MVQVWFSCGNSGIVVLLWQLWYRSVNGCLIWPISCKLNFECIWHLYASQNMVLHRRCIYVSGLASLSQYFSNSSAPRHMWPQDVSDVMYMWQNLVWILVWATISDPKKFHLCQIQVRIGACCWHYDIGCHICPIHVPYMATLSQYYRYSSLDCHIWPKDVPFVPNLSQNWCHYDMACHMCPIHVSYTAILPQHDRCSNLSYHIWPQDVPLARSLCQNWWPYDMECHMCPIHVQFARRRLNYNKFEFEF